MRGEYSWSKWRNTMIYILIQAPISFPPTYRLIVGTTRYDLKRTPSWCDRILYRVRVFGEGLWSFDRKLFSKLIRLVLTLNWGDVVVLRFVTLKLPFHWGDASIQGTGLTCNMYSSMPNVKATDHLPVQGEDWWLNQLICYSWLSFDFCPCNCELVGTLISSDFCFRSALFSAPVPTTSAALQVDWDVQFEHLPTW